MKHFRYTKLFGWLAAAALLLTTSCKDDMLFGNGSSDEVEVTFTLTPEAVASLATRAHKGNDDDDARVMYPDDGEYPHISDGSKADMLIYAIYEKVKDEDGNEKFELLEDYSDDNEYAGEGIEAGDGQTIKKITEFPVSITLTLKRGTEYSIAFWAQNHECKAYNTADLRKVEVIYGELDKGSTGDTDIATQQEDGENDGSDKGSEEEGTVKFKTSTPNNDESRDAFCRSLNFTAGESGLEQNVWLYRPLAQINVGTSGFDFESITRDAEKKYLYSKIRLNRVARYLDVVADQTYSSTTEESSSFQGQKTAEAFAVVDFGYAPLPAYVNRPSKTDIQDGKTDVPLYPSYTIWDWDYPESKGGAFTFPHNDDNLKITKNNYTGEEFLKVHLYGQRDENGTIQKDENGLIKTEAGNYNRFDIDGDGYMDYSNMKDHDNELSETFKYLSMCYVLTSSTKEDAITINNVKVWLATDAEGANEIEILNINNVPAQRNWRTNIIGNLLTEESTFTVQLDKDFAGDYNGRFEDNKAYWSGPLAKGVYYDAKADEIQISDVDGLLWLQRMVNGEMTVRTAPASKHLLPSVTVKVGENYKYYDIDGKEQVLTYKGISDPTKDKQNDPEAEALKKRILKATHQDQNEQGKDGWPTNNNFHFMGVKKDDKGNAIVSKATVRLMSDINLSAIDEWIPIGFDVAVYDGSVTEFVDIIENKWYTHGKTDDASPVRAFCGDFQGGNHTVSNLKNKRFGAKVHETAVQDDGVGPYDNPQWFPTGFFGMLGGNATVENLRLFNVDLYGYHTGGGIAGIACGDQIDIKNCSVDGGEVRLSPMFRGDGYQRENDSDYKNDYPTSVENANARTFARGIFVGGIVGYYNANGSITNNDVNNLTLKAYRNIGGLVGSMANWTTPSGSVPSDVKLSAAKSVSQNRVNNVLMIADKFQPYDFCFNTTELANIYKTGFGWNKNQLAYAGDYVGGGTTQYDTGNSKSSLRLSEFSTEVTDYNATARKADIGDVPLKELPLLSSWFCDNITLSANFYGEPSAKRLYADHKFSTPKITTNSKSMAAADFYYPFNLPFNLSVDFIDKSGNVGLYVESVNLTGKATGGRSVITPTGVSGENSCVMYVTARNRYEMWDALKKTNDNTEPYKLPTIIKNVVLRGDPYAWAGMLIAPNKNMSGVELQNVAIYDVYQTIALDSEVPTDKAKDYGNGVTFSYDKGTDWPETHTISLTATDCNFRGYTVPGAGWSNITYTNTTFEEGTSTGHGKEERTYKVEATTTFKGCYFKAPYIIDLSKYTGENKTNIFSEQDSDSKNWTYATAATPANKQIKLTDKEGCTHIVIESDAQGNPVVKYYKGEIKDDDEHLLATE